MFFPETHYLSKKCCEICPSVFLILMLLISVFSCKKESDETGTSAIIMSTTTVSKISDTSACSGGNITNSGGLAVKARGICWSSVTPNPTTLDSKTTDGTGPGGYVSNMRNLTANTRYYVRAYATNAARTAYGNVLAFSTAIPSSGIITASVKGITANAATGGGTISGDGSGIISRGVCWSCINPLPLISDNKTTDGNGAGAFISNITGLLPDTLYHIRAYATGINGTSYGNVLSFSTRMVPVVEIISDTNVLISTVDVKGEVKNEGGSAVAIRGFCYSGTTPYPTIADDTVRCGHGIGIFTGTVKGLKGQSTYYIRPFATSAFGTGYGSTLTVTTIDTMISDIDGNHYRIVQIGSQVWMAENLRVTHFRNGEEIPDITDDSIWENLRTPGMCWYDNDYENYGKVYGGLYNYFVIYDFRGLAPAGWHVASRDEWGIMVAYLGGDQIAGAKLKEAGTAHWESPNDGANNSTGFTALPGGEHFFNGMFWEIHHRGGWWESPSSSYTYYCAEISADNSADPYFSDVRTAGLSVRCVRN
jgi:uncharacterized protein (TIGR02145 family)